MASRVAQALLRDGSVFQPGDFGKLHSTGAAPPAPFTGPQPEAVQQGAEAASLLPGLPRGSKITAQTDPSTGPTVWPSSMLSGST